jgi:LDH2 family malate/lactate/ureidoglycolate dehydrogenase
LSVEQRRVPLPHLEAFISRAYQAVGMPAVDADRASELMAASDLYGIDTHGVFRLEGYLKRIRLGGMNLDPNIATIKDAPSTALIDGDNAMGHLVVARAADLAIAKAKETGIGWVGIRNSNHAGAGTLYSRMPLAENMIGLYSAVASANHMPPWGGTDMLLSANPISIAVPASKHRDIILDMATSVASYGKVKAAAQRGELMPEGWMIGRDGAPLTDPKKSDEGFLVPIGGAKGSGLSLMLGLLAGTLNGAAFGRDVVDFSKDFETPTNTGQFICALDIVRFADIDAFGAQVDAVIDAIKASPTLPGFGEVRLPGEGSSKIGEERRQNGIPIHPALAPILENIAEELNIEKL